MRRRIAIIDDEHGTTDLYVKALQMAGLDVEHFDNVRDGLANIEGSDSPPDLYVIDLMMPPDDEIGLEEAGFGLSTGIVLYRRVRERYPSIPIIILTCVSNPEILQLLPVDENTFREAKIDIMPFELAAKINEVLGDDSN